jgi:hypothetical protein
MIPLFLSAAGGPHSPALPSNRLGDCLLSAAGNQKVENQPP